MRTSATRQAVADSVDFGISENRAVASDSANSSGAFRRGSFVKVLGCVLLVSFMTGLCASAIYLPIGLGLKSLASVGVVFFGVGGMSILYKMVAYVGPQSSDQSAHSKETRSA